MLDGINALMYFLYKKTMSNQPMKIFVEIGFFYRFTNHNEETNINRTFSSEAIQQFLCVDTKWSYN